MNSSLAKHFLTGYESPLHPYAVRELRQHVALQLGARVVHYRGCASDERCRQGRALPEVVVIGLCHRRPEALLQVRLQRLDLLALALEARVVRQVDLDLDQADEAYSSSRSTCRVSKTSSTSPSFTS